MENQAQTTESKEQKPKRWDRQVIAAKAWLYRWVVLASMSFIGLNAADGYLTNYAHRLATQTGVAGSIEANPFLGFLAGNWALSFKGILGVGVISLIAWIRKFTPTRLFWWLMIGCVAIGAVIIWNLKALGVLT